jgi:multicomponent Na+:H+ antiporter subunit E
LAPSINVFINANRYLLRGTLARAALFFAFWLIFAGSKPADLAVGAVAATIAFLASFRLLPPGRLRLNPVASSKLVVHFASQSIIAGLDVARRALDPRMPLRPGFVTYSVRFRPGAARNIFTTLTSLLPGTVPAGEERGKLIYHCLDINQPVVSQLAAEEAVLSRALGDD